MTYITKKGIKHLIKKKLKNKSIPEQRKIVRKIIVDISDIELIEDYQLDYMISFLKKLNKDTDLSIISSFAFTLLFNDKIAYKKIIKFKQKYYMTLDENNNFFIRCKKTNNIKYFIKNSDFGDNKDLSKKEIDIALIYYNGEIHTIFDERNVSMKSDNSQNLDYIDLKLNDNISIKISKIQKYTNFKNILQGKDWIKYYLYHKEKDIKGFVYFLELNIKNKIVFKTGITKNNVEKRFNNLPKTITITNYKTLNLTMLECAIIERYIHEKYTEYREHNINIPFEGYTECYYKDMYNIVNDNILFEALHYLEYELEYPISSEYLYYEITKRRSN